MTPRTSQIPQVEARIRDSDGEGRFLSMGFSGCTEAAPFVGLGHGAPTDAETVSNLNLGPTEPNTAQYLPNSGGVDGQGGNLNVPVNTMNPYQTINYIIFTGVIV